MNTRIPLYKRLLSYVYPVPIRRSAGSENEYLELNLYCNQLQLATEDALYSDGDRYKPARTAVKSLESVLPGIRHVLVLGAGLCSMVHVIRRREADPCFTLVEKDKVVLEWAMEFLEPNSPNKTEPICCDAALFMQHNTTSYDLVFIDVFKGRVVPGFVFSRTFLEQCRGSLAPGGHVAFNYIVNDNHEWERVKNVFDDVFPGGRIVTSGVNRLLIS